LKLLTGGARDLPRRQQTLRQAIDWSYDLLGEEERRLLARLAVFVGGFTMESAEAVCAIDGDLDVFSGIEMLLDNSLLTQQELADGTMRFSMLESIREYAAERLEENGEMRLILGRHSGYFGERMQEMLFAYYTAEALPALDWTEMEHDNLRAMLGRMLQTADGLEMAPDMILALTWFWYRRGFMIEGREWSERVLAAYAGRERDVGRGKALGTCGAMAMWQGDLYTSLAYDEEALAIARWVEDPFNLAFSLMTYGVAHVNSGNDEQARSYLEEALFLFRQVESDFFQAVTMVHLGNVSLGLGDYEGAAEFIDQAIAINEGVQEGWLASFAINNRGEVARAQGRYEEARGYYLESESMLREMGDVGDLARLVHTLGYIAQHEGDLETAEAYFRESLEIFEKVGNQRGIAECLAGMAGLLAENGFAEDAARLLAAAAAIQDETGAAWWPADRVEIERAAGIIEAALDEEAFESALKRGKAMTADEAVDFALGALEAVG
jgi:tetratricopeptide (TPR) repeat protein